MTRPGHPERPRHALLNWGAGKKRCNGWSSLGALGAEPRDDGAGVCAPMVVGRTAAEDAYRFADRVLAESARYVAFSGQDRGGEDETGFQEIERRCKVARCAREALPGRRARWGAAEATRKDRL